MNFIIARPSGEILGNKRQRGEKEEDKDNASS